MVEEIIREYREYRDNGDASTAVGLVEKYDLLEHLYPIERLNHSKLLELAKQESEWFYY